MIRLRTPRRIVGVAVVAILAAGCGGAAKSALQGGNELAGAAGTKGLGANVMPAGTLAFGDANIDASSEGWKRALALGARFPGFGKLVLDFDKSLSERTGTGPTAAEIRSALGGEVAIGVTALRTGASGSNDLPVLLAYAEVKDPARLKSLITSGKDVTPLADRGGFSVFSQEDEGGSISLIATSGSTALFSNDRSVLESAIDRSAGGDDRLADAPEFKDAMKTLPGENILVGYVSTSLLKTLSEAETVRLDPQNPLAKDQLDRARAAYQAVKGVAYSLDATTGGFRLRSSVRIDETKLASLGDVAKQLQSFEPTLLSRVPSTAYFAASFQNLGPTLKAANASMLQQAEVQKQVAAVETLLGVKLDDLVALTSGEHALFVGPGLPASGGLLLKPADAAKSADTLRAATKLLGARGIVVHDTGDGQDATLGTFSGRWRKVGDVLAIGTDATVGDTVKDPLFESDAVKKLLADAGLDPGAKTAGAVYLDVPKIVDLVTALGQLSSTSTDQQTIDNLRHVGGILVWTSRDGDLAVSDVFVGVK